MWKRLAESEIARYEVEAAERRRRLRGPITTAGILACIMTAVWMLGYRGGFLTGVVIVAPGRSPFAPRATDIAFFVFAFVFMFVIAYRRQRAGGSFLNAPSVICTTCQTLADAGASKRCSCGGQWESIDRWEWVDGHPREAAEQADAADEAR